MGSQGVGSSSNGGTPAQVQARNPDSKSNPLVSQGSLYNLTLDEVQNHLGDLGKPLISMNIDELLKTVWTVEANSQGMGGVECGPPGQQPVQQPGQQPGQPECGRSLNRQSSVTLSRDLSRKTVDEVWQDIQQGQKRSNLNRKTTLGEMTLEDFLVKAGVVVESSGGKNNSGSVFGGVDAIGLPPQAQWMNYQIPSVPMQQLPAFMPSQSVQQTVPIGGNQIMDAAYPETQITMSSSPLLGTLSDTQTPGRKRVAPGDFVEKSVERRQKRMIKNRESAARSRARKQAYTHELENKVSRLEEENERLKRQKVVLHLHSHYFHLLVWMFKHFIANMHIDIYIDNK
ncbi:ABSCISIC ACID-INSENSITIVE 5-like protein 2-like [Dorcoceras hygrometricum]|uniref:ABSCISIC ACID-INSENSITIVE 5-like protein 2-like n=1 Tax=Dorcoceras hygrometricum TaxID=472368 RepID=A0A2Z7CQZ1_9LAMI|nr:ABSCISIC ACID-INSENSITIVE 5-like protein 2-like [Dorcoceras hygrometricum]